MRKVLHQFPKHKKTVKDCSIQDQITDVLDPSQFRFGQIEDSYKDEKVNWICLMDATDYSIQATYKNSVWHLSGKFMDYYPPKEVLTKKTLEKLASKFTKWYTDGSVVCTKSVEDRKEKVRKAQAQNKKKKKDDSSDTEGSVGERFESNIVNLDVNSLVNLVIDCKMESTRPSDKYNGVHFYGKHAGSWGRLICKFESKEPTLRLFWQSGESSNKNPAIVPHPIFEKSNIVARRVDNVWKWSDECEKWLKKHSTDKKTGRQLTKEESDRYLKTYAFYLMLMYDDYSTRTT